MGFFITDDYQESLRRRNSDSSRRSGRLSKVEEEQTLIDKIRRCEEEGLPVSVVSISVDEGRGNITSLFEDFRLRPSDGSIAELFSNKLTFVLTDTNWSEKSRFMDRLEKHLAGKGLDHNDWSLDGRAATYDNVSQLTRANSRYESDKQYFMDILKGTAKYDPTREVYFTRNPTSQNALTHLMNIAFNDPAQTDLLKQIKVLYVDIEDSQGMDYGAFYRKGSHCFTQIKQSVRKGRENTRDEIYIPGDGVAVIFANIVPNHVKLKYDNSIESVVCSASK